MALPCSRFLLCSNATTPFRFCHSILRKVSNQRGDSDAESFLRAAQFRRSLSSISTSFPPEVNYDEFEKHRKDRSALIIDVRESKELQSVGSIPGTQNIPLSILKMAFDLKEETFEEMYDMKVPGKDDAIITFCMAGIRSEIARKILMEEHGYENVANYRGSWMDWNGKNPPTS